MTNIRKSAVNRGAIVFLAGVVLIVGFITASLVKNGITRDEVTAVTERVAKYWAENAPKGATAQVYRQQFADLCIDDTAASDLASALAAVAVKEKVIFTVDGDDTYTETFYPDGDTVRLTVEYRVTEQNEDASYSDSGWLTLSFTFKKMQSKWKIATAVVNSNQFSEIEFDEGKTLYGSEAN